MGEAQYVCAVATKGNIAAGVWTISYKILLSLDGITWNTFKEDNAEKVSELIGKIAAVFNVKR